MKGISDEIHRTSKNKFVVIALQQTLRLVSEIKGYKHLKEALSNGLDVTIAGGNDFYSQRAKVDSMLIYALRLFLLSVLTARRAWP